MNAAIVIWNMFIIVVIGISTLWAYYVTNSWIGLWSLLLLLLIYVPIEDR